ncbi:MAG: hypothetical protein L0Z62_34485, partial [Gemmataceae bacterium]|nr:hypothetical protein [Gemmataceae bacterium]
IDQLFNPPYGTVSYKAIMLELNKIAGRKGWDDLLSVQGVKQAVDRYIEPNGFDPLPPRKDG